MSLLKELDPPLDSISDFMQSSTSSFNIDNVKDQLKNLISISSEIKQVGLQKCFESYRNRFVKSPNDNQFFQCCLNPLLILFSLSFVVLYS